MRSPAVALALLALAPAAAFADATTFVVAPLREGDRLVFAVSENPDLLVERVLRAASTERDMFDVEHPAYASIERWIEPSTGRTGADWTWFVDPANGLVLSQTGGSGSSTVETTTGLPPFLETYETRTYAASEWRSFVFAVLAEEALAGRTLVVGEAVTFAVPASPGYFPAHDVKFTPAGFESVDGRTLFRVDVENGGCCFGSDATFWYAEGVPLPAARTGRGIVSSEAGAGPTLRPQGHVAPEEPATRPGASFAPYTVDGPGEALLPEFPLRDAVAAARADVRLAAWFLSHPDAWVSWGVGDSSRVGTPAATWIVGFSDDDTGLAVHVAGGGDERPFVSSYGRGSSDRHPERYVGNAFSCADAVALATGRLPAPAAPTTTRASWWTAGNTLRCDASVSTQDALAFVGVDGATGALTSTSLRTGAGEAGPTRYGTGLDALGLAWATVGR